jgi:tRNA (guanine-N1)-methyltransferase
MKVPDVLISGNHKDIELWREEQRLKRTNARRKDLLDDYQLSNNDLNNDNE